MADTTLAYSPTKNVHTTSIAFTSPAWEIAGKPWKWKELQAMQQNLSPCPGDQALLQVTNRPATSELAGVGNNKLIQFVRVEVKY